MKSFSLARRRALKLLSTLGAAAIAPDFINAQASTNKKDPTSTKKHLRKIATEEAWSIPEIAEELRKWIRQGSVNLDHKLISLIYDAVPTGSQSAATATQISNRDAVAPLMLPKLLDTDQIRLADMDQSGVDMHLLSLTMPGVQIFDAARAEELARLANDRMSEAIRKHPKRYAGLAAFAPQNPTNAAKEMERAINQLKLNGFLVNSHTNNTYLDEEQCWPILEAAEALGYPLYIHPRAPSDGMAAPFNDYRIEGSTWGYGVETGTHIVRMIFGGVFDRFPKLQIVIGHMGEALPFWLWRLDFMGRPGSRAARKNQLSPSEYFQRNITITTSGVEDPLALNYCVAKIGVDRIMWAIDYPYQPTAPAVSFLELAPITENEREKIAYLNAERVFRIGEK